MWCDTEEIRPRRFHDIRARPSHSFRWSGNVSVAPLLLLVGGVLNPLRICWRTLSKGESLTWAYFLSTWVVKQVSGLWCSSFFLVRRPGGGSLLS